MNILKKFCSTIAFLATAVLFSNCAEVGQAIDQGFRSGFGEAFCGTPATGCVYQDIGQDFVVYDRGGPTVVIGMWNGSVMVYQEFTREGVAACRIRYGNCQRANPQIVRNWGAAQVILPSPLNQNQSPSVIYFH
jgi:hypothetical protein